MGYPMQTHPNEWSNPPPALMSNLQSAPTSLLDEKRSSSSAKPVLQICRFFLDFRGHFRCFFGQQTVHFLKLRRFTFVSHFWIEIATGFALELERFIGNSCSRLGETLIFRNAKCSHLREEIIERSAICGVQFMMKLKKSC